MRALSIVSVLTQIPYIGIRGRDKIVQPHVGQAGQKLPFADPGIARKNIGNQRTAVAISSSA